MSGMTLRPRVSSRSASAHRPRRSSDSAWLLSRYGPSVGGASTYLHPGEAGLDSLREGLRLALGIGAMLTALMCYVNLSDVLEFLSRHDEAAQTAADGLDLARRLGLTRSPCPRDRGDRLDPQQALLKPAAWQPALAVLNRPPG